MTPNFSTDRVRAYPWSALRRLTRAEASLESALARWLSAARVSSSGQASRSWRADRLRRLLRLDASAVIDARIASVPVMPAVAPAPSVLAFPDGFDPYAASCEVRVDALAICVRGASAGVRAIVQRMVGGPDELAAPRPLGIVEKSLWSLVVATALEDLGIPGHVWPQLDSTLAGDAITVGLELQLGDVKVALELRVPPGLVVRVPSPRLPALASWLDRVPIHVPLVVGRCAIARHDLARLAPRSLVTLEPPASNAQAELELFGGTVGLKARPGALAAEVVTGYIRRAMALPDDAHVELTVALGTTQLSLRQITELAVGQIVQLGRPLGGPFELRAAGRVLGRGELVDVDGELAVRIVSLGD